MIAAGYSGARGMRTGFVEDGASDAAAGEAVRDAPFSRGA